MSDQQAEQTADQQSRRDQIVDEVTDKVMAKPGVRADHLEVRRHAEGSVDDLLGQPVQTFTSLLAENEVVTALHDDARS